MKNYIILIALLSITALSCRKVIQVDLNSSSPRYTIVGNVTDQPGPYQITIQRSVNFNQSNSFPPVTGAQVYITDVTSGISDTLTELAAGDYVTHVLSGVPGHVYQMKIITGADSFSAISAMPEPVLLDSLYTQRSYFGSNINLVPVYKDPVGQGNRYHLRYSVGDSTSPQIIVTDDQFKDGQTINRPIENKITIRPGASLSVELQCIDHDVFDYYNDLQQTVEQNSATPANPNSNISGGALGYFSAHTVCLRQIIVQ